MALEGRFFPLFSASTLLNLPNFTLSLLPFQDLCPGRRQPRRIFQYLLYIHLLLAFQLPWQFAQFALLTQLLALVLTYVIVALVAILSPPPHPSVNSVYVGSVLLCSLARLLLAILSCQLVALIISWVLQLGNRLLLTSAYLPCLVGSIAGALSST